MAASGAMTPAAAAHAGEAPRTLWVGNFLSRHLATPTVGEELSARLAAAGWPVVWTSDKRPRLARLLDMQRTIWTRGPFAVAQIDVYSGAAFLWAELAAWSLRRRRTPYLLTLHGGRLPAFARRWPRRVRRLLSRARMVTTPSAYLARAMAPYRADIEVVPNPLDLSAYRFARRDQPRPNLVWLRAFHRVYNPQLAPRVLALVGGRLRSSVLLAATAIGSVMWRYTRRLFCTPRLRIL